MTHTDWLILLLAFGVVLLALPVLIPFRDVTAARVCVGLAALAGVIAGVLVIADW